MTRANVLARGQARDEIVELKDKADVIAPIVGELAFLEVSNVAALIPNGALGGRVEAAP